MISDQLFILLASGFIGWMSVTFIGLILFFLIRRLYKKNYLIQFVKPLINEKLEDLSHLFKKKFPMVGMFLSSDLENSMKNVAKDSIFSSIPHLKHKTIKLFRSKLILFFFIAQGLAFFFGLIVGLVILFFKSPLVNS